MPAAANALLGEESDTTNKRAAAMHLQTNMKRQVFRRAKDILHEVTRNPRLYRLILLNDVQGQSWVHRAPMLAPATPVIHQGKQPPISNPKSQISVRQRYNSVRRTSVP